MEFNELQRNWEALGHEDPLWAVCTDPAMRGGRWNSKEFMETGTVEIAGIFALLTEIGRRPEGGRALDFGCGVGRLSQALAPLFERVDGVDVAATMLARARSFNRFEGSCHYHLNAKPDLRLFRSGSFDFIYSKSVLQHMEPRFAANYIREFVRVLKPGGTLLFQQHDRALRRSHRILDGMKRLTPPALRSLSHPGRSGREPIMEIHPMRPSTVKGILDSAGAQVLAQKRDPSASGRWRSFLYCATKDA